MSARPRAGATALVAAAALLSACTSLPVRRDFDFHGAPEGSEPIDKVPVKGFAAKLCLRPPGAESCERFSGELIDATGRRACLLDERGPRCFPLEQVVWLKVKVFSRAGEAGAYAGWTVAGIVASVGNGFLGVITAPIWLVVGVTVATTAAVDGNEVLFEHDFSQLWQWSRFPAGMPDSWRERLGLPPRSGLPTSLLSPDPGAPPAPAPITAPNPAP